MHDAETTQMNEEDGALTETVGAEVGAGQSKPSQQHSLNTSKMRLIFPIIKPS
jgi:hypothetical protein